MTSPIASSGVLTRGQVATMAIATGTTIANLYYSQPMLGVIAASLGVGSTAAGLVPILAQAGFAIGLVFIAPLGDLLDRKRLIIALQLLLATALLLMGLAPGITLVCVASFLAGVFATSVQIVVPFAATLAASERRGQIVSLVFTGTLVGILSARIVSGFMAEALGWRAVFLLSAAVAVAVAGLIALVIPTEGLRHGPSYGRLLASTAEQWRRFPSLRRISLMGALSFGVFCAFWTTLSFQLSTAFGLNSHQIGLFGIAALMGAALSPLAGRLSDRISPARMQRGTLLVLLVGTLLAGCGAHSIAVLVLATVILDVGMQTTQVNSLAQIYALDPLANSRINTVYIAIFFIGGALGTTLGMQGWRIGGWAASSLLLVMMSLTALAIAIGNAAKDARSADTGSIT